MKYLSVDLVAAVKFSVAWSELALCSEGCSVSMMAMKKSFVLDEECEVEHVHVELLC